KYPIVKAIRHTSTPHLDLLTGSLELANADVALVSLRGREAAVARMLERVKEHYDLVVLDCPPGFSLLGINTLVAADGIIIPVCPESVIADSLEPLLAAIQRVRSRMGSRSRLLGIVLSLVDLQRKPTRDLVARLRTE